MTEPLHASLSDTTDRLARRELSAMELMQASLARIDATHGKLNAFVALRDRDALFEDARAADERIARGEGRPLEGIPLGVKDLENAEGLVTSEGSVPFKDNLAERDSVQVARLRAAGAIVVGKTNAPEFGYTAITKNLLFGETRNPWNLDHSPGGSSGGSSAAIAGGLVPLVTASDGGGSIRLPAAMTGCFGLKPSYGRIPHEGKAMWIMDDTSVVGPLTRTVDDAALHLDVTVGPHPLDPNSLPHPGISYRKALAEPLTKLRIGYSTDLGYAVVQSDVAEIAYDAARVFEELGHGFAEERSGLPEMGYDWGMVGAFELLGKLGPLLPDHEDEFGRGFIHGVKAGRHMSPQLWADVRRRREDLNGWCADIFDRYDLLLTPTLPYDPPPARGPFPEETEGRKQPTASVGSFTIPFNLSWHPAATVRAGLSKAGLPVGLQIVGPRHRDDLVLRAARAFERIRPWGQEWPEV
jgi:aspartyl-tRNA(Asn)/glutamyl-tRNA(Gln) amidotransferase subunit A